MSSFGLTLHGRGVQSIQRQELERENILLRVKDNYYARGEKGLYLGGVPIYGFDKIPTKPDGIKTSVLVPNCDMSTVEYIFSAYYEGGRSLGDIVRTLNKQEIPSPAGTLWDSSKLSRLLRSPVYVRADMDVYRYFKEREAQIANPVESFTGEHGCFLYGKREANERKYTDVHDHVLSIGLHEGVISSEVWLGVQRKLDGNTQLKKRRSGTYSWLTGLLKCGKCGYAMRVISGEYFYCSGKANHHVCEGVSGKPDIISAEQAVYSELKKKFAEIRELHLTSRNQTSPKANKLKMQLEALNTQIDNLVCKITETADAIGKVLEEKLGKLISERERIQSELCKLGEPERRQSYEAVIPLLDKFSEMPVDVKRQIAEQFIARVLIWEDRLEIQWRF